MPDETLGKPSAVEGIKQNSRGLRGSIDADLSDARPDFTEESIQLMKHHGSYQQDNRDTRTARKKAGLGRDYKMMVRTKFPGGILSPEQYLFCDALCDQYGQSDLRITSRQDFQFHGVVKGNLRPLIHDLNLLGKMTTLGGCGDVVRNTMSSPVADIDVRYAGLGADLFKLADAITERFMPHTSSYFDLWLDDEQVEVHPDGTVTFKSKEPSRQVEEPIYGPTYMPRKFKIALGTDFDNSVDLYTQDVGIMAITDNGACTGFEILVGGGLGYAHRKPDTYARAATPLAFVQADEVIAICEAVVKVQRDFGDRTDRKHARLKYVVEEWGIDRFRGEVFKYAGRDFPAPKGAKPSAQPDFLGWHKQSQDGLNYVGVWVENGRVRDFEGGFQFRTGLRKVVEDFKPSVRLTPHHNLLFANIPDSQVAAVQALLEEYGIPTDKGITPIRRMEMACPALPLCGLAMAESERAMPGFMAALEARGHGAAEVVIRMSGCPNNCSRPRSAEIGIVGSGADRYVLYTGGEYNGTRLNEEFAEKLTLENTADLVAQLLDAWKAERQPGEAFGDWSHRVGVSALREWVEIKAS